MRDAIVDTGPLVALLDRGDRWHGAAVKAFEGTRGRLLTTWPVLTEACHIVPVAAMHDDLLSMAERGFVVLVDIALADIPSMRRALARYAQLEPDLADLSLLALAERTGTDTVLTFDRDFLVFRVGRGRRLNCPMLA
jgi:hypothetical protein